MALYIQWLSKQPGLTTQRWKPVHTWHIVIPTIKGLWQELPNWSSYISLLFLWFLFYIESRSFLLNLNNPPVASHYSELKLKFFTVSHQVPYILPSASCDSIPATLPSLLFLQPFCIPLLQGLSNDWDSLPWEPLQLMPSFPSHLLRRHLIRSALLDHPEWNPLLAFRSTICPYPFILPNASSHCQNSISLFLLWKAYSMRWDPFYLLLESQLLKECQSQSRPSVTVTDSSQVA